MTSAFKLHTSLTLVISAAPESARHVFTIAVIAISVAQIVFEEGHYVRGAIVQGGLVHRPDTIYGPAFVQAHMIEKSVAKYPRVVIAPNAEAAMRKAEGSYSVVPDPS